MRAHFDLQKCGGKFVIGRSRNDMDLDSPMEFKSLFWDHTRIYR